MFLFILLLIFSGEKKGMTIPNSPQDLKGAKWVVDFGANWCQPCLKSLPELEKLAKENPEIRVIVICVDETRRECQKLASRTKIKLPVIWDQNHEWAEYFRPKGMPAVFVINEDVQILYSHSGFNKKLWEDFKDHLQAITSTNPK